jgi:hypothetical protein
MDKKPLGFADFVVTKVVPEEDDYLAYRRQKRKRLGHSTSEAHDPTDQHSHVDEALTVSQRLQRKKLMKRIMPKIKLGRERASRRVASKEKLQNRSLRKARMMMFKKLTKDIPKGELSYARRQEIEKRLDKPQLKNRIKTIAKKLFPKERKAELEKKRRSK